jgi:preprotein translocase subunit SecF
MSEQPTARPHRSGLATRLYRGEAGINVVGRRKVWFGVAGAVLLLAILSFTFRGFTLGIDFKGGNEFQVPATVGSMQVAEDATAEALGGVSSTSGDPARVVSAQQLRGTSGASYLIRTTPLQSSDAIKVKESLAKNLNLDPAAISDNLVSAAWGAQVTRQALYGLIAFLVLVIIYLIIRFEWRMAVAAVSSLALDLLLTATVYSLVGFEVTPSTIIGFLTILGFALYDVVVVFDKIQENTRGITASSTQTYADAANLAVNQTLMRSINTGLVALLPVGGLLFIGAGLLGAGTLKDLGLVLFFGMGAAVYSSIFFATPVLVTLKEQEPRYKLHTQRVLARRAGAGAERKVPKQVPARASTPADESAEAPALAAAAPRAGARPAAKQGGKQPSKQAGKRGGGKGGPRGGRPSGAKRR